ncbi:hypothetical protein RRG08_064482 [Elysia crispata]|uniref:Uncharacterized protein n=1 Tax=Elysia crispata TaxID=231223 RepID=A0AAE1DYG2_9GAST|nr:hypothetical protein RRG08_064482 [Elysia crispata]
MRLWRRQPEGDFDLINGRTDHATVNTWLKVRPVFPDHYSFYSLQPGCHEPCRTDESVLPGNLLILSGVIDQGSDSNPALIFLTV